MMKIVLFMPTEIAQIVSMLQALVPGGNRAYELEIADSVASLLSRLTPPRPSPAVVVLIVSSFLTMQALEGLRSAFERQRLVFVLDTSDRAIVEEAHSFHPRVVVDIATAADEVPMILQRMERVMRRNETKYQSEGEPKCRQPKVS